MRVVIAVATADAALRTYIAASRNTVVPPEIGARGYLFDKGAHFSIQLLALNNQTTGADLGVWLRRLARAADGLILLIDEAHRRLASDFEDAYFVANLTPYQGRVFQNQVRATLAPILRHFIAYSQRFDDLGNQRVLLLPLDIFLAADLAALRARMTTNKMQPGLGEDIDRLLATVNRRARPKSRKRYRTVYLVDDRPLWYRYGPERHKIVQTVQPPHLEECWHNSRFRFGRFYDDQLHHNVDDDSDPTRVYGNFTTCHGQVFVARGESHLNVFPNGFI